MTPVLPFRHDSNILDRLKREAGRKSEDVGYAQLLIVRLGDTKFAIDALSVMEVSMAPTLIETSAEIPFLCGVVNIRGNVIPVFDPAPRLNLAASVGKFDISKGDEPRLVVMKTEHGMLSMMVDDVELRLFDGRIPQRPADGVTISPGCARLVEIDDKMLPLLELDVLLTSEELKALVDVKNLF